MVNAKNADFFISLHCNASASHTGNGVEVHTYRGRKLPQAAKVCEGLSKLGFRNRGIKDGSGLYVVKNTNPPAMLVEMLFLDNNTDQLLYKKHGCNVIARAIADALV